MAEQDRADAPDRVAHGGGHTEKHEAEKDGFRPGVTGGVQTTPPDTGRAEQGAASPVAQSIESTTAALGDMEPSAGTGGASEAETAGDKT
jgi:hypothetical protein